jgi:hypothetical protein
MMADQRAWLRIPNFLNVVSNLPFAVVGLFGLAATFGRPVGRASLFVDSWERWPYAVLFAGVILTTFGSAYYHIAPDNARLVWDRLPMAVGFMALLTAVVAERVDVRLAQILFVPLLAAALSAYAVAKAFESGDRQIFAIGQIVSGHTLKHLVAAAGVGFIVAMLRARAGNHRAFPAAVDPAIVPQDA